MLDAFKDFTQDKNIDRTTLVSVLEELPQRDRQDFRFGRELRRDCKP